MLYPQGKLIVFSKAPEPGYVMTRLAQSLEEHGQDGQTIAAKIHEFLVLERLAQATKDNIAPVELWCAPDRSHPFFNFCEDIFPVTLKDQPEGDLGERMEFAFENALSTHAYAVLIGTDCPGMNAYVIRQAFQYLSNKKSSVICPAIDGGYVLIGLEKTQPGIFRNMKWGSSQVFEETRSRLQGSVGVLPSLWDVDRIEDLRKLIDKSGEFGLDEEFTNYLNRLNI